MKSFTHYKQSDEKAFKTEYHLKAKQKSERILLYLLINCRHRQQMNGRHRKLKEREIKKQT